MSAVSFRDFLIAWIALGPRHNECMEIERRLCIEEAQLRAEAILKPKKKDLLSANLSMLRLISDQDLWNLFDKPWRLPFSVVFFGEGASRSCKRDDKCL